MSKTILSRSTNPNKSELNRDFEAVLRFFGVAKDPSENYITDINALMGLEWSDKLIYRKMIKFLFSMYDKDANNEIDHAELDKLVEDIKDATDADPAVIDAKVAALKAKTGKIHWDQFWEFMDELSDDWVYPGLSAFK